MIKPVKIGAAIIAGCAIGHAPAHAVELSWSGFGSVVGGKAINQQKLPSGAETTFLAEPTKQDIAEAAYEDFVSFRPDTNLGLQATADFGDGLKAITQVTAKGADNFQAVAEWVYASYDFNDNFTGTIGRQRAPFYIYSDYIDVAYAYHWLRQPLDLYGEGIAIYEGASGLYKDYIGNWDYEFQGYYGSGQNDTSTFGDVQLEEFGGLIANITDSIWRFRVSAHHAEGWLRTYAYDNDNDPNTPPDRPHIGTRKDNPSKFGFYSAGATYDDGQFFAIAEYTLLEADEFAQSGLNGSTVDKRESWMLSFGTRFGAYTPHITISERDIHLTGDVIPPFEDEILTSKSLNLGLRYDFHSNAAFKIDLTKVTDESTDFAQTALGKSREVSVIAAGVDFVF